MRRFKVIVSALLAGVVSSAAAAAAEFNHAHTQFGSVLDRFVSDEGLVDYAALREEPAELDRYLDQLADVSRARFNTWSEPRQIAFLINLYNAATLKLITEHYPVDSIKDIGGLFRSPFKRDVVRLFGETVSLDTVEHGILRKRYSEPRIHFALVCAALSCPELRREPYVGERLDEQLDDQGRGFLRDTSRNRVDLPGRTLRLSEIFKWFREDFEKEGGSVQKFLADYLPSEAAALARREGFRVRYLKYDWSLNEQNR